MILSLDGPANTFVEMSVFADGLPGARLAGFFAAAPAAGFFALVVVVRLVAILPLPCLVRLTRLGCVTDSRSNQYACIAKCRRKDELKNRLPIWHGL